ncbi:hypothetical protein [Sphingopyxis sp. GW247-27LB]|uniref:hypothetical protein n=1 Tax=Sphingopyxis sp. GW247-27LB TaxID=2012632 RepID=UPI000BA5AD1B|nr:hypothetical protein [Sphingopyxis sp. GW247-27LB]PAL25482.1 hypothetical protein CD928_03140 [Sphingopyxis sp. GW247-27LB]
MAALTEDRIAQERQGRNFSRPVAADKKIFLGALVCLSATGYATPGATATTLVADGIAMSSADNTDGADGDIRVDVRKGTFPFKNSAAGDAITIADIGSDCYIVDDQTVAKTDGATTRSIAGKIVDLDAYGVWVEID